MAIKKYTDWNGWFDGMIDAVIPTLATAVTTVITTNGLDNMGVTKGLGENWKTACAQILIQGVISAANYVKNKPRPSVITETYDTTFTATNQETGATTVQSSTTTTTTPTETKQP